MCQALFFRLGCGVQFVCDQQPGKTQPPELGGNRVPGEVRQARAMAVHWTGWGVGIAYAVALGVPSLS